MFFHLFTPHVAPRFPHKRHSRLTELDRRMQDFLAAKRGRASANVLETVASARDRVRSEIELGTPSRSAE
ncbi:hypothetical protein [Hoeflea sp.]|uniref:hypothetical protein n=1 Tax=Hoeflea sp. TaxID=1940281 RepID=UPI003B52EFB8